MTDDPAAAVLVEQHGAVTRLLLNRPESLNAIDAEVGNGLLRALHQVAGDPGCRCVLLTGSGRGFCSGQSLSREEIGQVSAAELAALIRTRYGPIVLAMRRLEIPVVAGLNGVAAGAGLALALAADVRVAAESASLSCVFSRIGLVPDSGVSYFLVRMLGVARSFELASSARLVAVEEARELGLVSQIYPDQGFAVACLEYCQQLASGPTRALALTKRLLEEGSYNSLEAQLRLEEASQLAALLTRDFQEGVDAFFERRAALFGGN